jgi:general secretion pathway protein C
MRLLRQSFWVVHGIVIAICAMFAGSAVAHLLAASFLGPPPARAPRLGRHNAEFREPRRSKEGTPTLARNIFCSGCAPAPKDKELGGPSDDNSPRPTTLPIELVSTMIAPDDDRWSMAILRDLGTPQKDPGMYNKGAKVAGARVLKVLPRRVYLRHDERIEYVDLEGPTAPAATSPTPKTATPSEPIAELGGDVKCAGGRCTLPRATVDKVLSNTAVLATSVHVLPMVKDGRPSGFRLDSIRPGSIFSHLQLQNGDTLKAVNGSELTTPDQALALYMKLKTASHLSLQVERQGATQTLDYVIQ